MALLSRDKKHFRMRPGQFRGPRLSPPVLSLRHATCYQLRGNPSKGKTIVVHRFSIQKLKKQMSSPFFWVRRSRVGFLEISLLLPGGTMIQNCCELARNIITFVFVWLFDRSTLTEEKAALIS